MGRQRLAARLLERPELTGNLWHADHVLAVRDGGGECSVDNMQVLCVACHADKTQRERRERGSPRKSPKASPRKLTQ